MPWQQTVDMHNKSPQQRWQPRFSREMRLIQYCLWICSRRVYCRCYRGDFGAKLTAAAVGNSKKLRKNANNTRCEVLHNDQLLAIKSNLILVSSFCGRSKWNVFANIESSTELCGCLWKKTWKLDLEFGFNGYQWPMPFPLYMVQIMSFRAQCSMFIPQLYHFNPLFRWTTLLKNHGAVLEKKLQVINLSHAHAQFQYSFSRTYFPFAHRHQPTCCSSFIGNDLIRKCTLAVQQQADGFSFTFFSLFFSFKFVYLLLVTFDAKHLCTVHFHSRSIQCGDDRNRWSHPIGCLSKS